MAAIPCAETSKTELIYDIFRELVYSLMRGVPRSATYCVLILRNTN